MAACRLLGACGLLVASLVPLRGVLLAQSSGALPSMDSAFFTAVRENLARAGRLERNYAYKERRTEIHTNPFGRVGTGGTVLREFAPLADGSGYTRRILERDGAPVPNAEVERVQRRTARTRGNSRSALEDAASVMDFAVDRREVIDGRPTVVVRFTPKAKAQPQTREGRLAQVFIGQIWVDEMAQEVVRAEATAIGSISYGFGLIARIQRGTVVTLARQSVEGDIWLPVSVTFRGRGRALLFRRFDIDYVVEWFDYRRFPVSGSTPSN